MKKANLILLFALATLSSFGQKIRFSDSTNTWRWFECSHTTLPIICNTLHDSYSGTIYFDTHKYIKYGMSYIREDTATGIVYIRYWIPCTAVMDTTDRVLYNYNWSVGDTVWPIHFCFGALVSWVTTIDSTKINSRWYKVWHFQGRDTTIASSYFVYNVIEGIGCTNGIDYPINPYTPFENSQQLICFSNQGNTDSLNIPVSSWGIDHTIYFDNSISCATHTLKVNKLFSQNRESSIIPNPIDNTTKIAFPYNISGSLTVLNSIGQVVVNMPFTNKDELLIGDKITAPGLYYYRVTDEGNGKVFSGKFVY